MTVKRGFAAIRTLVCLTHHQIQLPGARASAQADGIARSLLYWGTRHFFENSHEIRLGVRNSHSLRGAFRSKFPLRTLRYCLAAAHPAYDAHL